MKRKPLSKILGWGLSAGIVFASIASVFAAPAIAGEMEWTLENTPSWEDMVILPASDILDYDIGGDGDTIYAVLEINEYCVGVGDPNNDFALVKSTDGGITWKDITDNVTNAANLPEGDVFESLTDVAVAPDDENWIAVAGYSSDGTNPVWVVASKDGGDNFSYTGDMTDNSLRMIYAFDLAVSIEVDDIHNIALAGMDSSGYGSIYRLKAGTWLTGAWEDTSDTTDYLGWDNGLGAGNISLHVFAIAFSPNFDIDDTIVCLVIGENDNYPFIQSGIWESGGGSWNDEAGFPTATEIESDGDKLKVDPYYYRRCLGLALPADYDGSDPGARSVFLYANARNMTNLLVGGYVFRSDNNSLSPVCGPSGEPLLASIDVHGDADTGKLMIGEFIQYDNDGDDYILADCCQGVRVWHTEELDFCCPQWDGACKDPSGFYMALVMYTPDGEKEYATTSGTIDEWAYVSEGRDDTGTPLDESAFSVSLDDAVSFNQIGLIDTDIDYLSDVAICPDCSVIYLSTINQTVHSGAFPCLGSSSAASGYCDCDSVWRSYDDGATWERIFHGDWADNYNDFLLLRLPCDITEECCTLYLGIYDTNNIFYTRDCGQCWNDPPATKITIQDIAIESENIVYVIDDYGMFSMSTQYGRRWSDAVDTGLDSGHSIASCCNEGFVVVGGGYQTGPVAWSDDSGNSWNLTDDVPQDGYVHVACDPECVGTIYAAVNRQGPGKIYRTTTDDGSWTDLNAKGFNYTGIAVARTGGTLYASSYAIKVDSTKDLCEEGRFTTSGNDSMYSGVARNLTPCETACCGTEDWDYLICGLESHGGDPAPLEFFNAQPSALRICGCLSLDTNSILWAIDTQSYDVVDGSGDNDGSGGLWSYEDCAAKHGPTLTSPADESVLDCELCAGCGASPFTLKWERMCNACSYDIEIMDEDGNLIFGEVDITITGTPPTYYVDSSAGLTCGETYTWHVREANTSCECVHSPWSETWTFTIAVGSSDAIALLSPDEGALGVPVSNVGFSWTSVPEADSYTFTLSPNANLTGSLVSQDQGTTAYNFSGPLDYSKAYYWQVKAWKGSVLLTTSSVGVFNTMAEPEAPTPPVVVNETPAPVVEIPPAQNITPGWIYAVIGIGAALVVVVIVLIVRTRRP